MPVGEFDGPDERFNYESDLDDEVDTIQFGKYKGLTPVEVLYNDPGYIVWATNAFPQGWVGSEKVIELAKAKVPAFRFTPSSKSPKYKDTSGGCSNPNSPEVKAFEAAMLEAFGEFPTPYWKMIGARYD